MSVNCHHAGISRMRAEDLLIRAQRDGTFLIRNSESLAGAYILCVLHQGRVYQYRILPDQEKHLYIKGVRSVEERKFVDLFQLIHEYVGRGEDNGLVCALKHALEPQAREEEEKDSEDEDAERRVKQPSSNGANNNHQDVQVSLKAPILAARYIKKFNTFDLSGQDGEFVNNLRDYCEGGIQSDISAVDSGSDQLPEVRKILAQATKGLERQLNIFLEKVSLCERLFLPKDCQYTLPNCIKPSSQESTLTDPTAIFDQFHNCKSAITDFERRVIRQLEEEKKSQDSADGNMSPPILVNKSLTWERPVIPDMSFDVRQFKHGKVGSRMILTVELQKGRLLAVKATKDCIDESNTIEPPRIEQLVKWTNHQNRLDIKIEGRKKDTYVFDNVWQREHFCQLVQKLKTSQSKGPEVDHVSVFVGTWNMGSEIPPWNMAEWLKSSGLGKTRSKALGLLPHDLYAIGTQESGLNEKEWVNKVKVALQNTHGQEMHTVATVSLWSLRLVILVRSDYKHKISHVNTDSVKTGIANALGNKGAVAASLYFNGTSFCFVNSHLTSGHERNNRRIQNVRDILTGLSLGPKCLDQGDVTIHYHHLFFFGDLNFRLEDMGPNEIIGKIVQQKERKCGEKNYHDLLLLDQLRKSQQKKEVFLGFCEEEIIFPPTYRIEKGTIDKYDWRKVKKTGTRINAPSWCDRVLWKSYPDTYIKNTSYGCVEEIATSDHKPVFATFDVGIIDQFISPKASSHKGDKVQIIFKEILAEVKTSSKQNFQIEFNSTCLEQSISSNTNVQYGPQKGLHICCPKWSSQELPVLSPLFDDRDYLEDQHLLLSVKHADSMESYGECVLSLKSMVSVKAETQEAILTHEGEETGKLRCSMHVKIRDTLDGQQNRRRLRSYELIYMDTNQLDMSRPSLVSLEENPVYEATPDTNSNTIGSVVSQHHLVQKSISVDNVVNSYPAGSGKPTRRQKSTTDGPMVTEFQPIVSGYDNAMIVTVSSSSSSDSMSAEGSVSVSKSGASAGKPVVPPRRPPKMGQSSLNPSQVLPVVVSPSSSSNNNPHCGETASGGNVLSVGQDENCNFQREGSKRKGTVQDFRNLTFTQSEGTRMINNSAPPPLPRKQKTTAENTEQYEALQNPKTINEWLLSLGLPQYISIFHINGWDQIGFISDITEKDLLDINIKPQEHRLRILQSIKDMKR